MGSIVPPLNFAMVVAGVYRSGYPNRRNHSFLKKLKLKSILYLCPDDYSSENLAFIEEHQIEFFHFKIKGNKEPFVEIDPLELAKAIEIVMDQRNHPILLHCNKGKHRIGCLVGIVRKLQGWTLTSIFDEYQKFAGTKIRIADQEFIELFDCSLLK